MAASRLSSSIAGLPSVHSSNKQGASPSFCHLDRPFLLSSRPPLPFVISTKRSAWRDLSTTLEMTKVLHLISLSPCLLVSLSPCFATDFAPLPRLCRKRGHVSHASRMKMKKKLGMSPIFIVSLHRDSENNKFNNKKLKKGNKLWQRM